MHTKIRSTLSIYVTGNISRQTTTKELDTQSTEEEAAHAAKTERGNGRGSE